MPSLNEIFSKRAKYIPEVEARLKMRGYSYLPIMGGDPITTERIYGIDWCHFSVNATDRYNDPIPKSSIPIVLLTGWSSGWEGILPLGFSLDCEGYEIYLLSLPGYGFSKNPPSEYYQKDYFLHAAMTVKAFCDRRQIERAYFVGHSMGDEIIAKLAEIYPNLIEKLVLLSPSGIQKEEPLSGLWRRDGLFWRFMRSSCVQWWEHERLSRKPDFSWSLQLGGRESYYHPDYIYPLAGWCENQKSPFRGQRFFQRWAEYEAICEGTMSETIKKVAVPVVCIFGQLDTVFSPWESERILRDSAVAAPSFKSQILFGLGHNPTLYQSEITAAAIAHYLEG
jgi:pimeloyl-ACP methyl ester carboxylesterase